MERHYKALEDDADEDGDGGGGRQSRFKTLEKNRFVLLESDDGLPPFATSQLPAMAADLVSRRHFRTAGIFAEWYLNSKVAAQPDNGVISMWKRVIGRPTIPYNRKERRTTLSAAFEDLRDEVRAWTTLFEKEQRRRASNRRAPVEGAYPNFGHASQVKKHLRECAVARDVRVRKVVFHSLPKLKPGFAVTVDYTREELTRVNPATPKTGNPFNGVEHDRHKLPDFVKIEKALKGSNAGPPMITSPKDD
jgi:hypothetical protein